MTASAVPIPVVVPFFKTSRVGFYMASRRAVSDQMYIVRENKKRSKKRTSLIHATISNSALKKMVLSKCNKRWRVSTDDMHFLVSDAPRRLSSDTIVAVLDKVCLNIYSRINLFLQRIRELFNFRTRRMSFCLKPLR